MEEIHFLLRWKNGAGGAVEGSADAAGCLFRSSEFLDAAESKPFRGARSNFKVAGL